MKGCTVQSIRAACRLKSSIGRERGGEMERY